MNTYKCISFSARNILILQNDKIKVRMALLHESSYWEEGAEALPDSDYLRLLRYLSFFSVLDNRFLTDNPSQLPKVSI